MYGVLVRSERSGRYNKYTMYLADARLPEGGELAIVLTESLCAMISSHWRNRVITVSHLHRNDYNQLLVSAHSKLVLPARAEGGPFQELQDWADVTFEGAEA